ncbi:MAG: SagB/ThcOx family dehydrogenase [Hespellia sp.]|nr:SagB/ThcOx family dehydrogenase [Hespellia sp.]
MKKDIFWAPSYNWKKKEEKLLINGISFALEVAELFPKLYELCINGTTYEKLQEKLTEIDPVFLKRVLKDLKDIGALVSEIQSPADIFQGQSAIFLQGEKPDELFFMNKENVEKYRFEKSFRKTEHSKDGIIELKKTELNPGYKTRKSIREFDMSEIDMDTFSRCLEILCPLNEKDDEKQVPAQYVYPSAGGLYPLDFYLLVKAGRVENVPQGLYRFDPVERKLYAVNNKIPLERGFQFTVNKETFVASAFSVYIFFDAAVSMPKYQDMAYYYSILDTGFAAAYFEMQTYSLGLGTCSIGDMRFSKISEYFELEPYQKYLHTIEVGKLK